MAREPREFGVPSVDLIPENEPAGFMQTGLFPATTMGILRQQQQKEAAEAAREHAAQVARRAVKINAQWDKDFPYGAVVKPEHDTLRGYKYILKQDGGVRDVQFSPYDYGIFDGIIARQGGVDRDTRKFKDPAFNKEHPHYEAYAPLRRNIAILRNYLLVTLLPEGKGDGINYTAIKQMATKLGSALSSKPPLISRWFRSIKRLFSGGDMSLPETNRFREAANVPDQGIATMYNYLFDRRDTPVSPITHPVEALLSKPWGLLPIESTPFSEENMLKYGRATILEGISNAFENVVTQLHSVDTLSESDKQVSVEEARNILEKLRITVSNKQEESNVDVIEDTKQAEAEMMLRAAMAFKDAMAGLAKIDPNLMHDPMFADAKDALSQMDYLIKVEAREAMYEEGKTDAAKAMSARIATLPKRSKPQPVSNLVARLRTGIDTAARVSQSVSRSQGTQAARKLSPAQQAVQSSVGMFAPGTKVKQISNPALMLYAQRINEQEHDHHTPGATPQKDIFGKPVGPGRK